MSLKSQERKERVDNLRMYQQPVLNALALPKAKYIPKCAFKVSGKMVMGFFPSELEGGVDIYTEKVNANLEPEGSSRQLYKWRFDQEWDISYPTKANGMILIPVDELSEVPRVEKKESQKTDSSVLIEDAPISQLTIKDIVAILWIDPVSDKEWLNKLIKNHIRTTK